MLIGITGKAGVGKDEVAKYLKSNLGFNRVAFADPIKEMVNVLLRTAYSWEYFDLARWDDRNWKEQPLPPPIGVSPRVLAQTLGTEWARRTIHPDIWRNLALHQHMPGNRTVISDVRFDNEAEAIVYPYDGIVLEIQRDVDSVASHASEEGVSEKWVTHVIDNNGSLADLYAKVDAIVSKHLPGAYV